MNSRVLLKRSEGVRKRLELKIQDCDQLLTYCVTGSPLACQLESLKNDLSQLNQSAERVAASFGRESSDDEQVKLSDLINRLTSTF